MTLLAKEEPLYKEKEDAYSSWYVFSDQDLRTGLPAPDHFSLRLTPPALVVFCSSRFEISFMVLGGVEDFGNRE